MDLPPLDPIGSSRPNKRTADEEIDKNPRKTRGVKIDFKRLDDLFSDCDEEGDSMIDINLMINNESYIAATNDRPINLNRGEEITRLARLGARDPSRA